ncbi:MAG TPA: DUF1801 domain-containing protein [Thermoanaerobaculia bacterium]
MTTGDDVARFLADYPPHVQQIAERLRQVVRMTIPEATDRVYRGWRLIGYRRPSGRSSRYFCFIAPLESEVRLGFEYGVAMRDSRHLLTGDGTQVRYLTFRDTAFDEAVVGAYLREAATVAELPPELRKPPR